MSYSGGFGHAPPYNAALQNPPGQNPPRPNEHSSRRARTNMERSMVQYESRGGGGSSQGGGSSYDPREQYSHTERRSTHGYDRRQENRDRRFPNEGYDGEDTPEFGGPSRGSGRQPVRSGNARRFPNEEYNNDDEPESGGPSRGSGRQPAQSENAHGGASRRGGRQPDTFGLDRSRRIGIYASPDGDCDYGVQNRDRSFPRFNPGQALSPQSRRTPRSETRSNHEHILESHTSAGIEDAEWWAEHDRRDMRPTPNQQFLGYWTSPDEQNGDPVFVPNPYLHGRMAARAADQAAVNYTWIKSIASSRH